MVLATYGTEWKPLSSKHEELENKVRQFLADYSEGKLDHLAYAAIGTFGAGKTQFLYHIFKCAVDQGLLPLYVIAEDLFAEIIKTDRDYTPGELAKLIEEKAEEVKQTLSRAGSLSTEDRAKIQKVLDPRGKSPELLQILYKQFSKAVTGDLKIVLLVDELEGQYRTLQRRVKTDDMSPMREALECPFLKFLALAPAGIYEMGNADQTRVIRLVIPAADVDYVKHNLVDDPGKANSCWWLSRGKARHLFKACNTLKDLRQKVNATEARRIIQEQLDHIGQKPTQVPPAVIEAVPPSRLSYILRLSPIKSEVAKRYHIDTNALKLGELAEKLIEAFGLSKHNALLLSEYFKLTTRAVSDQNGVAYVGSDELTELLCLTLDHLLEYEHGSPELAHALGEVLSLYERVKSEAAAVYGILGRLWELKETEFRLPLAITEIRRAFPFPVMNPIVKDHEPSKMRAQWEGKGLPLWRWTEGNVTTFFFASSRDFDEYFQKDEFLSTVLPDEKGVVCLFPTGEGLKLQAPVLKWLKKNGKLQVEQVPTLLADFLLSATGEIEASLPGDLRSCLDRLGEDKADVLLSRKTEIYREALIDIIEERAPKPRSFDKGALPDAETVWGKTQIAERQVAVGGLALAFADFSHAQRELLARVRELFRGGREGRGTGDLNRLMPRGGYIALADDLLPRYGRRKQLADSQVVRRIQGYWSDEEREELIQLARVLPLEKFLGLCRDENLNRVLEALWRTTRQDFTFDEGTRSIQGSQKHVQQDILPTLAEAHKLEKEAREKFGATGIEFGSNEGFVKAKNGFEVLLDVINRTIDQKDAAGYPVLRSIVEMFMSALDVEGTTRAVRSDCVTARQALGQLTQSGENLRKNYWEYGKACKFIGLSSRDGLTELVSEEQKISGTFTLRGLAEEARERAEHLEEISARLGRLDAKLGELGDMFGQIMQGS